ncbi:MAG: dephospho-CoA kinase [Pseudomonadota bacterium]
MILGLTGSVAMGKSTTAALFREEGVPVWDADAAVHALYSDGGAAVPAIAALVPEAVPDVSVDRTVLREAFLEDPALSRAVEEIVHPLVARDRATFLADHDGCILCDVPLLFETGGEAWCNRVVVVTAPPHVQRERFLARPGMDDAAFEAILARQMPDAEKRARADFVIDTSHGIDAARRDVQRILKEVGCAKS